MTHRACCLWPMHWPGERGCIAWTCARLLGWSEYAPYDRILVTAAAPALPRPLTDQLADGGLLIAPIGPEGRQILHRYTRRGTRLAIEKLCACSFVPLIGGAPTNPVEGAPGT